MLALSGPDKVLQWLLSQLLIYSFYVICGNELEVLALVAQGQKSLFPHWPALHHLFCYHLYWCGDVQKKNTGFSLYQSFGSREYSRSCTGTQETNVPHSGLSLGGIPGGYSDCTLGGIGGKQDFNGTGH